MATPIRVNGAKLAEARIRAGLTQTALAALVGVNRTTVFRIETGERSAAPGTLVALAKALGVPLDAIADRVAA